MVSFAKQYDRSSLRRFVRSFIEAWLLAAGLLAALPQLGRGVEPNRPPVYAQPPQVSIPRGPLNAPPRPQLLIVQQPPAPAGAQGVPQTQSGAPEQIIGSAPSGQNQTPEPFSPDQTVMPLMGAAQTPLGATPRLTPQVVRQFNQFVDGTIDPQETLDLLRDRPRLLLLKEAPIRVQVGDPDVASYTLITDREISVQGNKVGSTILNFWFADPNAPGRQRILSYLVRVMPDPAAKQRMDMIYKALEVEINRNFPNSAVQLALVGDKVVVRGDAKDMVEAAQILQVVGANTPGQQQGARGGVRQASYNDLMNAPVNSGVNVQNQQLFGTPQDFVEASQAAAENVVANQILSINSNVINLLRVSGEQQVMLRVTIAEVNRNAMRSIGMNLTVQNKNGIDVFQQLAGAATIGVGNLPTMLDNGQVNLAINALRHIQLARSLAEPNLVTTNGQPARFHSGNEFPVPNAIATFGAVGQSVTFVPVGVSLMFTPAITDRDRIRLQVFATVRTIDQALSATIAGTSVPGTDDRTFVSTVEMREGQTLAVAGLIQNNFGATTDRVPLWGDLPLIGALGGSRTTITQEQELVILVTPELVHPLQACHTPPVPGADVFEPGDIEFFLFNRLESLRNYDFREGARTDWGRICVYEKCERQLIIGPQGRTYGCCTPGLVCPMPGQSDHPSFPANGPPPVVVPSTVAPAPEQLPTPPPSTTLPTVRAIQPKPSLRK